MRRVKSNLSAAMLLALLAGCAGVQQAQVRIVKFEERAAPIVADACARFRRAEANPLLQLAVAGGAIAATAATGGVAGPVIAAVKSYGDAFCAGGPPAGDATTPEQQAAWLNGQVTAGLIEAAAKLSTR